MEETEFYRKDHVIITNARFIVGSTTYAMNGVTSVKRGHTDPDTKLPVFLALIGIVMVFAAATLIFKAVGVVLVIAAIAWLKSVTPEYHVFLNSSSGESQALSSKNKIYIDDVITSLNNAIISRG